MMQDGIVARYLKDHCPEQRLKLCPYRNELPATADDFLWDHSMFDTLGRFRGLDDEMSFIVRRSLIEHPLWQAEAALVATAQQLADVATDLAERGLAADIIIDRDTAARFGISAATVGGARATACSPWGICRASAMAGRRR